MIIILDIDNTLCNNKNRWKLATEKNGYTNWDVLYHYDNMIKDEPNVPMIQLVENYKRDGYEIIIFTSRPESTRKATEDWLKKYNISYDGLFMRSKENHYIKSAELKNQMYYKNIKEKVFCAFDDESEIIDMWVEMGIPSFKVYLP